MDVAEEGIPLSEIVAHDYEAVNFYCRTCHRHVSATPAELLALSSPETGIWTLVRRMKCKSCGEKDFTVRLGYPRNCQGIGRSQIDPPPVRASNLKPDT